MPTEDTELRDELTSTDEATADTDTPGSEPADASSDGAGTAVTEPETVPPAEETEAEAPEENAPVETEASEDPAAGPTEAEASSEPEQAAEAEEAEASPEAEAAAEEEEDDEDDELDSLRFLPGDWYVVHTYSGYENKVKANLSSRIQSMNMEDKIFDVVVPTEEVMELKSGRMQAVQKKVFPGYILVRIELDDDSWYVVRNTPGVTGFVGPTGAKPLPLEFAEVKRILAPEPEDRPAPRLEYEEGEVVSVISGAFSGMTGPIDEINMDQQKVKVLVDIFGRDTPVELSFDQVAKL